MPLINCEISFILTWSIKCVIPSTTGKTEFAVTNTKHHVPAPTYIYKFIETIRI